MNATGAAGKRDVRLAAASHRYETVVRAGLFLLVFAYSWISVDPFVDLSTPDLVDGSPKTSPHGQLIATLIALACGAFIACRGSSGVMQALLSPALVCLLLWIVLSAVLSGNADLALRRVVLALMIILMAATLLMLPRSPDHFAGLLAVGGAAVLVLSFGGVLLVPNLSIHLISDPGEPNLAGNWRGPFLHKNVAGAAMAVTIFIGLFVARAGYRIVGIAIAACAAVFLFFTQAKTSIALAPLTLLLGWGFLRLHSGIARLGLVLVVVTLFNLFTVGTVLVPPMRSLVEALGIDPTFTNRTEIWQFGVGEIQKRPLLGYGLHSFWQAHVGQFSTLGDDAWLSRIASGHNGYFDLVLMAGLPALGLLIVWIVVRPVQDLAESQRIGASPALDEFFVRVWIFGLLCSCLESVLFSRGGVTWFMMLVAVFGLRLQAKARLANAGRSV